MLLKLVCVIVVCNCAFAADQRTIWQFLNDDSKYSTLVGLVKDANLQNVLEAPGAITILAPTNSAFDKLSNKTLAEFKSDPVKLSTLLTFHIVNQSLISPLIGDGTALTTLAGQKVTFHKKGSDVFINTVQASTTDTVVSNGVVHTLDGVLVPATENLVQYLAKHDKEFSDLFAAIIVVHLESALENGEFTLFAPTDDAFAKITNHLPPNADGLSEILKYHVVPGTYTTDVIKDGQILHTLEGEELKVDLKNGVKVGTAMVTTPNILVTNGVIHIIDTVQVPPKS